jgi:hypothetical protein
MVSAKRAESMYCLVLMILGFSPSFSYSTTQQWLYAENQSAARRFLLPIHAAQRLESMTWEGGCGGARLGRSATYKFSKSLPFFVVALAIISSTTVFFSGRTSRLVISYR